MARKRLNKNVVVSLTLFTFVMVIVVSVLTLGQLKRRDPKYFVQLAKQYEEKKEWLTAAVFYRKAWDHSQDAAYLVSFGDMVLKLGDVDVALQSWRAALISQPTLTEAHLRELKLTLEVARLNRQTSDWNQVRQTAQAFLDSEADRTEEQAAFAHHAHGLALVELADQDENNERKGLAELIKAVESAPDVVDYALDLARYYVTHDRIDEGERHFETLMHQYADAGADAAKVRLHYAKHLAAHERFDEADATFKEGLRLGQPDPETLFDVKLGYAAFLSQQWARAFRSDPQSPSTKELFDKAEAILKSCVDVRPDEYGPYLQLAVLYSSARRYENTVDICEARIGRGLVRKGVKATRNRSNAFMLMIYASEACVAEASAAQDAGDEERRQAWLTRAEQYVTSARGEFPSHPRALSQLGRVKLARGLEREALEDLRAAEEQYRAHGINWDNTLLLASVHLKLNEAGAAKAVLEQAMEEAGKLSTPGAIKFWVLYAQTLLYTNEPDQALRVADRILRVNPHNAVALRVKAAVLEQQNRLADAAKLMGDVPDDRILRAILEARAFALDGDTDRGVEVLRKALEKDPANARLVGAAVRELLSLGRGDEARTILRKALKITPKDLRLQSLEVLTREDLTPEARDQAILSLIQGEPDAYQRAIELIGFHLRRHQRAKCLPLLDTALQHLLAKDTPAARNATVDQHRALLMTKLDAAGVAHDDRAAREARDEAARFNVDGAGGKSLLGLYHMQRQEYDLAIRAFREAVEAQPTDARSLTYLGQCLHVVGRLEEAQAFYENAIRVNPNAGPAHRGLAVLAKVRGDTDLYEASLTQCRHLMPDDPWVRSEVLAQQERADPRAAIKRRRALLNTAPNDVENLKRLIELCEAAGDVAAADEYCDRLLALVPNDKDVVIAADRYYQRTGRPERSLTLLRRYADSRTSPEDRANALVLVASYYLTQHDEARAESTLLAAANVSETLEVRESLADFYLRSPKDAEKALPWLDKAIDRARAEKSPRLAAVLAKRVTWLLRQREDDLEAARRTVDELLTTFPNFLQGFLLSAEIYARTGQISEAVDTLNEYLRQKPDDPFALYQRALHQLAQGHLAGAVEDLKAIKRTHPLALDLEPRLLLARLHREAGRTKVWIRELESLVAEAPDSVKALKALVRAYVKEDRMSDAERVVTVWINRAPPESKARWLFNRSQIAVELGDEGKALADAQRAALLLKHSSGAVAQVLTIYAKLGRPVQGIDYYRRYASKTAPASALTSRYARLLAAADRTAPCVEQFRRAMQQAVEESPSATQGVIGDLRATFPSRADANAAIALFERDCEPRMARVNDRILVELYALAGRRDDATRKLEALVADTQNDPRRAALLHKLAELYQEADRLQQARQAYEESLKYRGDNWVVLNNLAYLLSDRLGRHARARDYAERAVALAPNVATLDTLGWILVGLETYRPAIAVLHRAVRTDPDYIISRYHLGEAYRRSGQFDEAESVLGSGQDLARQAGDKELSAKFEGSLQRVASSDRTP